MVREEKVEVRLKINKKLWQELKTINDEYLFKDSNIKTEIVTAALETFIRWYKEKKAKGEL